MKFTKILLVSLLLMIGAYVVNKAVSIGFTHDECLTYKIVQGADDIPLTNNHLLNTWMMQGVDVVFGASDFALRLPNLLSFLLYLIFSFFILTRSKQIISPFVGLALILLNPYLLDFFCLARGYGLSLGFAMAGLYFMIRHDEYKSYGQFVKNAALYLGLSLIATLASYICINLTLAFTAIAFIELFRLRRVQKLKISTKELISVVSLFVLNFLAILIFAWHLFELKGDHQMDFGGTKSFIDDVVTILIHRYIYMSYYGEFFWIVVRALIISVFVLILVYGLVRRRFNALTKTTIALLLVIYAILIQHFLFDSNYPPERSSLLMLSLFGTLVFFFLEDVSLSLKRPWRITIQVLALVMIGLPMMFHFTKNMNDKVCLEWRADANTKAMVRTLDGLQKADRSGPDSITLTAHWQLEPAINFYRESLQITSMKKVDRGAIDTACEYVYCFKQDSLPASHRYIVVKFYGNSQTVLYKNLGPK